MDGDPQSQGGTLTQRRSLACEPAGPHLPSQGWCAAKVPRRGGSQSPHRSLGPSFRILRPLSKVSGVVRVVLPNKNVGQSSNPQGLGVGLYLVTGSLQRKSSYNEVIKAALSQCDRGH